MAALGWLLNLGYAASPSGAETVTAAGAYYSTRRKRKTLIIDGERFYVNPLEERQIIQAYIDRLNEERKEVEQEVKKEKVKLKRLKVSTKKASRVEPERKVIRAHLSDLLESIREIERKIREAKRLRKDIEEQMDEEDSISLLLSMGI